MSFNFTISDLKKHLGPGLGLRKSKYLLEIPIPGAEGTSLNILCKSAGLPERNISVSEVMHKGRKYKLRGETDYIGTYEISILDDSNMKMRKLFDKWLRSVDNTKPKNSGILGSSFESTLDEINSVIKSVNNIKTAINTDFGASFFMGFLDKTLANAAPGYQTDINIWQLSGSGDRVYGYKLQNAFPSSVGIVTLDDGEIDTLSEFSVVFAFSEFIPLTDTPTKIRDALIGDDLRDVINGVENLFD